MDSNYLREKYKALRRQFNASMKRWEETGQGKYDNFWKCSGATGGTSDEGCWYILHTHTHEGCLYILHTHTHTHILHTFAHTHTHAHT